MKKYLLTIVLLFITSFGFSQYLGGTLVKGTKPIKRIATTLDTIAISSKNSFVEPAPAFRMPPTNTEVGTIEGQLNVSLTGGATYNIPIAVPPGINSVVPQVSLNYNSQAGNGMAGYGWNIGGLSSITKIASTKFHDNLIDPVDFDASDRYAFDGQRLMLKTGTTYGASGTIYETENFSNVKITANGTHPLGAAYGPASFFVEYPDGATASYATVTPTDWGITYWQNAQGVRVNYRYTLVDNMLFISKITYGATFANPAINEINFDYSTTARLRPEEMYIGGLLFKNTKILNSINVKGNLVNFKNYTLLYNTTSLNYQRLASITEKCGDSSLALNPTVFSYTDTQETINYNNSTTTAIPFTNVELRNSATVAGDYNGDGKMDFAIYPTLDTDPDKNKRITIITNIDGAAPNFGTTLNLTTPFINIFPTNFITFQNKLSGQDGFTTVQVASATFHTYDFTNFYYSSGPVGIYQQNKKTLQLVDSQGIKFIEGDFNGDGLTDLLGLNQFFNHFINLDMRDTTSVYSTAFLTIDTYGAILKTGDVNGDGKTDLFVFKNQQLKVYSLNQNNQLVETINFNDSNITLSTQILMGDLNGDGKTDFTIPNANLSNIWFSYISSGNSYLKTSKAFYNYNHPNYSAPDYIHYILQDFDNDAKSDFLVMKTYGINSTVSGSVVVNCFKNKNNYFDFSAGLNGDYYAGTSSQLGIDKWALPIFYNSNQQNRKLELAFIRNNKIHFFQSQKDFNEDKLMRSVTNGNGVIEVITYKPLVEDASNNNNASNPNVYFPEAGYLENYPNTDIVVAPTFQVVKKLERVSADLTSNKKQFYSYYGAVSNLEGLGFLGFRGTMRTNWHTGVSPFYLISNVARNDISLRGVNVENYTAANFYRPNQTLCSFCGFISKNKTTFNVDNATGTAITPLQTNKVFKLFANKIENSDGLLGTSSETKINYDNYNNPLQSTVNTKNGLVIEKTNVTTFTYQNTDVAGSTFIIGRPLSKTETSTIYPTLADQDVFGTIENYTYADNLLTRVRKRGNASTQNFYEYNDYDVFGNITKKTISDGNSSQIAPRASQAVTNSNDPMGAVAAPITSFAARITNYAYNPAAPFNGRFMTSSTDVQGLITTYDYNLNNGTLITETKPYNLVTSYGYDKWFKKTQVTDFLNNTTAIQYVRDGNKTKINTIPPTSGDAPKEELFNDLGLKIKSGAVNIDGSWVYISNLYNIDDKIVKTSEPFIGTTPIQWNETVYDSYGRVSSTIDFKNKTTTISYSNLSTTIFDGTLDKTIVKNALGNIITTTDNPGGTITNKYFANGNLKSTTYDNGGTTTITQDNWGRKKTLTDPSAGMFSYDYNLYGETLKETNPNGSSTYVYDDFGKLLTKKIVGTNGNNSLTTNTYDTTTKLLTATSYNDITAGQITNYTFGYDNYKRPNFSDESSQKAYFQRATQYDSFGRASNQLYISINPANTSQRSDKWTCNIYKNGYLHQLKDGINGAGVVLYQTNSVNAKGQVLTAQMANGVTIANQYDIYGFPTKMQHDKGLINIMTLNNTFDNVRGNLKTRDNNLFGTGANLWSEDFTNRYDSNDRLTGYKDQTGNYVTQTYNANGTINTNAVGTNTYNSAKPFQASFIPVTNPSPVYSYYNSRAQTIVYNAIKKPISIAEVGQENINFDYNINGQRSTMYYGNTNPDKNLRTYIKSYSADGSMEIRKNTISGTTEFITYLGGDAYSAPLMLKTDGTTNTSQNFLYLHRDYQGSILAITNNVGVVQEKRLFDAWGALIKFWSPTSSTVPTTAGIMIIDRGYTGHEHLLGVGLINMNGRLYDPAFHRFLSPDNNLQEPGNTQNYNRYGYCLNNPLSHTDKTGEFVVFDSFLVNFFRGLFNGGIENAWNKGINGARNDIKIWGGLSEGSGKQKYTRGHGEILQTYVGLLASLTYNFLGEVDTVEYYDGATVLKTYGNSVPFAAGVNGVTLGSYIIGNNTIEAQPNNPLFQHEYGHYLQSQRYGPLYFSKFGIPSARGNRDVEFDANSRSFSYFSEKLGSDLRWNFEAHPLNDGVKWNNFGNYVNNPTFQLALTSSLVTVTWRDYFYFFSN